jgi:1-acyl-sn-glycerol-3-phosphate acyltransferase
MAVLLPIACLLTKRSWRGRDNLPAGGGYIVAANHISNLDFLAVIYMLVRWSVPPRVLAKESLFRLPIVGIAMRRMGMIPVYRGTSRAGTALKAAAQSLKEGAVVMIYPEGTVTRDPGTWPMRGRPGAVKLALETGRPLIPVAQWGAQRLLPYKHKWVRVFPRTKIEVVIGEAIDLSDLAQSEDKDAAAKTGTERLMATLTTMVAELRGEQPPAQTYNQFDKKGVQ